MHDFKNELYVRAGLENMTETIFFETLQTIHKNLEKEKNVKYCTCGICLADVAAIVLGSMKPYYYTNFIEKDKLKAHKKFLMELKKEMHPKILDAFEQVLQKPHH